MLVRFLQFTGTVGPYGTTLTLPRNGSAHAHGMQLQYTYSGQLHRQREHWLYTETIYSERFAELCQLVVWKCFDIVLLQFLCLSGLRTELADCLLRAAPMFTGWASDPSVLHRLWLVVTLTSFTTWPVSLLSKSQAQHETKAQPLVALLYVNTCHI